MSFIACVFVLVGLMHFSVCVIFVYLSSLRCSRHFSILHARQSFFLPSFLNPNFSSHTKTAMFSPAPSTVVSSHLSPLAAVQWESVVFQLCPVFSTVSSCHFAPKVANVQLRQSFQRSIHTQWSCSSLEMHIHPSSHDDAIFLLAAAVLHSCCCWTFSTLLRTLLWALDIHLVVLELHFLSSGRDSWSLFSQGDKHMEVKL